jgi:hypothetical protein
MEVATPRTPHQPNRRTVTAVLLMAVSLFASMFMAGTPAAAAPACGVLAAGAAPQANSAVINTCHQIGVPYSWGGGHGPQPGPSYGLCDPSNGAPNDCHVKGVDCSGLVRYGYALAVGADILGPGNTDAQWHSPAVKSHFYSTAQALPGDLLFYSNNNTVAGIHHVAMYLGAGWIVEAANSGELVKVSNLSAHSDFYGGARLFSGRPHYTTTLGLYRGLSSMFYFSNSTTSGHTDGTLTFGAQGDIPVSGDWNADGYTTVGTYRPSTSTFYFDNSNVTGNTDGSLAFGVFGDLPVTGDWDCDGSTTVGVYRDSNSTFYLDNSNITGNTDGSLAFGQKGDVPITGDWNGDGCTTIGVYRPSNSTFYLDNSNITGNTDGSIAFGETGDVPVTGDWNGDGYTTIGVFRPATGTFYLCNSNLTPHTDVITAFGKPTDTPLTGAWNH